MISHLSSNCSITLKILLLINLKVKILNQNNYSKFFRNPKISNYKSFATQSVKSCNPLFADPCCRGHRPEILVDNFFGSPQALRSCRRHREEISVDIFISFLSSFISFWIVTTSALLLLLLLLPLLQCILEQPSLNPSKSLSDSHSCINSFAFNKFFHRLVVLCVGT